MLSFYYILSSIQKTWNDVSLISFNCKEKDYV